MGSIIAASFAASLGLGGGAVYLAAKFRQTASSTVKSKLLPDYGSKSQVPGNAEKDNQRNQGEEILRSHQ